MSLEHKTIDLMVYRGEVQKRLKDYYGLELIDMDLTDDRLEDFMRTFEDPEDLVLWLGEKYNLTHTKDLML